MQAHYPVRVQAIRSKGRTDRFYVFIPLPLAAAIDLEAGEQFQWSLTDRNNLAVRRIAPPEGSHPRAKAKKRSRK